MKRFPVYILVVFLTLPGISSAQDAGKDDLQRLESLPMEAVNFRFPDTQGRVHELADYADRRAVVLFAQMNGCPIVRQSYPYLREIRAAYEPKGVAFLYFSSNQWDTDAAINEEAGEYGVTVPILRDEYKALAHALDVERSAEVFVINPRTLEILYRGMADDRFDYGLQRSNPEKFWLRDALDACLADTAPATRKTIAKGCLMDLDLVPAITFNDDIAPILRDEFGFLFGDGPVTAEAAAERLQVLRGALLTRRAAGDDGAEHKVDLDYDEGHLLLSWLEGIERL